jgi:hypothetical protein
VSIMSDWGEKLYAAIELADPYLDDQALVVSGLNFIGLLVLGESLWKSCVFVLVVYAVFCVLVFVVRMAARKFRLAYRLLDVEFGDQATTGAAPKPSAALFELGLKAQGK